MQTASRYPWGKGTPRWYYSSVADNDVTITVPVDKIWKVSFIEITWTCTADAGARSARLYMTDGANIVFSVTPMAMAATQSGVQCLVCGSNAYSLSRNKGTNIGYIDAIGECVLPVGYTIRTYDANNVAATDGQVIRIHYIEYDA